MARIFLALTLEKDLNDQIIEIKKDLKSNLLKDGVERSFNSITVDGDTSTSDTCALFATGDVNLPKSIVKKSDKRLTIFKEALDKVLQNLAKQIVCDGEGAKKLIKINVSGAKSEKIARKVGLSVANSPLVKTAIAGEDANWGRIVMAIGKAGVNINLKFLIISINNMKVSEGGLVSKNFSEKKASKYMKEKEIEIKICYIVKT